MVPGYLRPEGMWRLISQITRAARTVASGMDVSATADLTEAIRLDPQNALPYSWRAMAQYHLKAYDKAWQDVEMCRQLGGDIPESFLKELMEASGREE